MAGVFVCVLARLGKDGSIVQIGGPKDDNVWSGPNRKISFGIFEICWGLAIDRETYASSSTGYFDRNTVQDFVDMERARMKVTRVCVYHVDHDSAGKSHGVTGEGFCTHAFCVYLSPGYHCWWRCKSFMLSKVRKTVEQLLQHVDLPILDRKDGTDYGQIFQGCPTEQQGL